MSTYKFAAAMSLGLLFAQPALAAPGLGDEVYGASIEKGATEAEVQYDSLRGGPDHGEDVLKLELSHSPTEKLRLGLIGELEREPGASRKLEAIGFEAIYHVARIGSVDLAVYGEYELGIEGSDKIETKLLLQRRSGPVDLRLNLIGTRKLESGQHFELGYAASADYKITDEVELGVEAFGGLGTFDTFLPHAEHFIGPVARFEIEGLGPELELSVGYLFAFDKARDDTDGQLRFKLEFEF